MGCSRQHIRHNHIFGDVSFHTRQSVCERLDLLSDATHHTARDTIRRASLPALFSSKQLHICLRTSGTSLLTNRTHDRFRAILSVYGGAHRSCTIPPLVGIEPCWRMGLTLQHYHSGRYNHYIQYCRRIASSCMGGCYPRRYILCGSIIFCYIPYSKYTRRPLWIH